MVNVFDQANRCCLAKRQYVMGVQASGTQAGPGSAGTLLHLLQRLALSRGLSHCVLLPQNSICLVLKYDILCVSILPHLHDSYFCWHLLPMYTGVLEPSQALLGNWVLSCGCGDFDRLVRESSSSPDWLERISNSHPASVSPSFKMGTVIFLFLPLADIMKLKWNHKCECNQGKGSTQIHHRD